MGYKRKTKAGTIRPGLKFPNIMKCIGGNIDNFSIVKELKDIINMLKEIDTSLTITTVYLQPSNIKTPGESKPGKTNKECIIELHITDTLTDAIILNIGEIYLDINTGLWHISYVDPNIHNNLRTYVMNMIETYHKLDM